MDSSPKRRRFLEIPISEQTLGILNSSSDGDDQRVEEEEEEEGEDFISSLPESVIGLILSKLPTKSAVATAIAILSAKWRQLFYSIPNPVIKIDDATEVLELLEGYSEYSTISNPRFIDPSFMKFVSQLFRTILPQFSVVEELDLALYENYGKQRIGEWFSTAPPCNVRCIKLYCVKDGCGIPSLDVLSSFATSFLCSMSLFLHCDLDVPQSIWFPNLTSMEISGATFLGLNSFEKTLAACPKLSHLTLIRCEFPLEQHVVHISVPSLTKFEISRCYRHNLELLLDTPCLESLEYNDYIAQSYPVLKSGFPSLCDATLDIPFTQQREGEGQLVYTQNIANLLAACYKVKTICFDVRSLAFPPEASFPMRTFPYLTSLDLFVYDVGGWEILPMFLQNSPILQVLNFRKFHSNRVECYERFQSHLPDDVPTCLSSSLSEFVFEEFKGDKDEVKLVQYFLRTARVLEKMKICFGSNGFSYEEVMEIQIDILSSPICSINCHIEFANPEEEE